MCGFGVFRGLCGFVFYEFGCDGRVFVVGVVLEFGLWVCMFGF